MADSGYESMRLWQPGGKEWFKLPEQLWVCMLRGPALMVGLPAPPMPICQLEERATLANGGSFCMGSSYSEEYGATCTPALSDFVATKARV